MFFSGCAVWGHRGWPTRFPDNTEAGIRTAATVAAGVEVDVRRSVDGQLVLSHDPLLGGFQVADTRWDWLCEVDLGGHRPALLDQILDLAVPLDLEVKNDPEEPGFDAAHRIGREVADRARPGDLVTSFWWPTMDAVRRSHPDVSTALLLWGPVDPIDAVRHAVDHGHGAVVPEHTQVTAEVVDFVRSEGLGLITWTVNDSVEATRLAELGVDAIITDRPGEMIAALTEDRS